MEFKCKLAGWTAILGILGFVSTVLVLHLVQPDYDPSRQLMSELALGPHGAFMVLAFCSFGIAVVAVQYGIATIAAGWPVRALLLLASVCLFGAGLFRLGQSDEIHISLVAVGFVALVMAMYALPRSAGQFGSRSLTVVSWTLAAGAAGAIAAGHSLVPMGVGQRIGVAFVLGWLAFVAVRLVRTPRGM